MKASEAKKQSERSEEQQIAELRSKLDKKIKEAIEKGKSQQYLTLHQQQQHLMKGLIINLKKDGYEIEAIESRSPEQTYWVKW